jgi:putative ABC transport system permease protein
MGTYFCHKLFQNIRGKLHRQCPQRTICTYPDSLSRIQNQSRYPSGYCQWNIIASRIREEAGIAGASARMVLSGMVSSAKTASGAQIFGIDPEEESKVFDIHRSIIEGEYFSGINNNPIVIGKELAEKLNVSIKSKVVLTFTDKQNNVVYGAFRIAGIFDSSSPMLDLSAVYLLKEDLERLINEEGLVHQIAIRLKDQNHINETQKVLLSQFPDLSIQTWKELAPELDLIINQSMTSLYILLSIIMLALAFGIVNTMLMAVLERMKELGMLMAIGMKRTRIFLMIILETIMIALVGGPIGLLIGFLTIQYFYHNGLDLSMYSEALEQYGMDRILYMRLEFYYYIIIVAGIITTAIIAAIYPAIKAVKLKPADALHKI